MGGFIGGNMLGGAMKKFRGGGGQAWKKQPGAITQSGTGGPSQGWGGGVTADGGKLGKFAGRLRRAGSTRRDIQGIKKGYAGAPTLGGSTAGRKARRQRMRQMGRPQPPQSEVDAAVAPPTPAGYQLDPTNQGYDASEAAASGINAQGTLGPMPAPNVGGFGLPSQVPVDSGQRFENMAGQWGSAFGAPAAGAQLQGPASGMDFGGGPAPMAPPPGPGGEIAPIGGEDPRRFRGRPGGGGGWGGVLNLGR